MVQTYGSYMIFFIETYNNKTADERPEGKNCFRCSIYILITVNPTVSPPFKHTCTRKQGQVPGRTKDVKDTLISVYMKIQTGSGLDKDST